MRPSSPQEAQEGVAKMVQGPAAYGQYLEAQGQTLEGFAAVVWNGTVLGALALPQSPTLSPAPLQMLTWLAG